MCFHGNQLSWGIKHLLISLWSKYHFPAFIRLSTMLAPVISSLDEINCTSFRFYARKRAVLVCHAVWPLACRSFFVSFPTAPVHRPPITTIVRLTLLNFKSKFPFRNWAMQIQGWIQLHALDNLAFLGQQVRQCKSSNGLSTTDQRTQPQVDVLWRM